MGYAFISYSSSNQKEADAMRELFKKNNIGVWMAPYDIPAMVRCRELLSISSEFYIKKRSE